MKPARRSRRQRVAATLVVLALGVAGADGATPGADRSTTPATEVTEPADAGSVPAEAFLTAGELLRTCRGAAGSREEGLCLEFIFGLARTVAEMQQRDPSTLYFCIDPQTTPIQTVRAVLVGGLEKAEAVDQPAFEVAIDVLGRTWPCARFDPA
jgi:hypothetical protein